MKSLSSTLLAVVLATTAPFSWGTTTLSENLTYADGVKREEPAASCAWESSVTSTALTRAKGNSVLSSDSGVSGFGLSLHIIRFSSTTSAKKSEYAVVMRADMKHDGKLVATQEFEDDASSKNPQPGCDALQVLGRSLGERIADWVVQTRFPECKEGCIGIHPDEPIVVGAEILIGSVDALNDTVRNECGVWTTDMAARIAKAFNETEPRAKIEIKAVDIEKYPGRRLLLYVDSVHALGGGGLTGPKWMTMRGELREGTFLVGSFKSNSLRGRGLTTCRSLESLSDHTTSMITEWLKNPSLGSSL